MKMLQLRTLVMLILSAFIASAGIVAAATPEEDWQRLTKEGWAALEADRPADAEKRMKEALACAEGNWPDQPRVAGSLSMLAQLYVFQKKHEDAEPLYRRGVAILEKSLGPNHPDLAPTLEAYALLLRDLKRPAEAKEMEARAVALKAKMPEQQWQQRINSVSGESVQVPENGVQSLEHVTRQRRFKNSFDVLF